MTAIIILVISNVQTEIKLTLHVLFCKCVKSGVQHNYELDVGDLSDREEDSI